MQTIAREQSILYEVSPDFEPALRVKPGEKFKIQTNDHMNQELLNRLLASESNMITFSKEEFAPLHSIPMLANPVAGPVYVEGARAGDLLAVHIWEITPGDKGSTCILENLGLLHDLRGWEECHGNQAFLFDILPGKSGTTRDGTARFEINGHEWTWKLNPHIGTILTCPKKGRGVPETLTSQGAWGGNLDVRDVCEGNTIYLNSFNEGGLLYIGDVHASQGDSELTGAAIETYADVVLSVEIIKNKFVHGTMRIETPDSIIQIDSSNHAGSPTARSYHCLKPPTAAPSRWSAGRPPPPVRYPG